MKIVLTGASSPIGKIVLEHLRDSHEVVAVSRSTNWDLTNTDTMHRLNEMTADCDVFINLAHIGYLQGVMLGSSKAKINISFTSLITQFEWSLMQSFNTPEYISQKLFLEYVHNEMDNSALVSISNYGAGIIPSVTDDQICNAIDDIIQGRSILPVRIEVSNGIGDLSL